MRNTLYKNNETYCVGCKKYTTNENASVKKTKQNRINKELTMFGLKWIKSLTNIY